MIPTIEDILNGYRNGQYSLAQCLAWIAEHARLDAEAAQSEKKSPETHRDCICDDPQACTEPVPGYRCRKGNHDKREPISEERRQGRLEGRAEFVSLLLSMNPEDLDDWISSHTIGCTGDYGQSWIPEKVAEHFASEDASYSLIERLEGMYWECQGQIMVLEDRLKAAQSASTRVPEELLREIARKHAHAHCNPINALDPASMQEEFRCQEIIFYALKDAAERCLYVGDGT